MLTAEEKRSLLMGRYEAKRQQIDSRIAGDIERYRKGACRVKVADGPGLPVKVTQKSHDFKFGANIFMLDEFPTEEENRKYKAFFKAHFNMATVPFYWDSLEPEEGKPRYEKDSPPVYRRPAPEKCMEYCKENGIDAKLHCLVYDKFVPDWLVKLPLEEVEKKYEQRFREIAERYRGRMYEFEVINELLAESDWPFKSALSGKRDILEWSFALAKKYFPNETLVINETTSRIGLDTKGYRSPYFQLVENALLKGVPIDKIGIQHHMFTGSRATTEEEYDQAVRNQALKHDPEGILRALDMIWELGLPLEITEVTIPTFGDTQADEQLQAELLKLWYSIWFSHPGVDGIVYWNTVDHTAWINPEIYWNENNCRGGLLHRDLTPKRSALMLKKLLTQDWHTELTLTTDAQGCISFRGFFGDYEAQAVDNTVFFGIHKCREDGGTCMKKTALVTGGSRGIGRAIALRLAKDGFRVLVHYAQNLSAVRQVMDEIKAIGGQAVPLQADLCDPEQAKKLGQAAAKADVLVLNASVQLRKSWQEITVEDCHRQINCNFISSMLLIQSAVPYMRQQAWGRIVTIGSVQERKPHPDMLIYSASKAAQTNMVQSLALQLAPFGITVNNVAPGVIATDRNADALSDPVYAKKVTDSIPAGHYGEAEDLVGIVSVLCSDAGRYITGQSVYVDGGKGL